MADPTPSPTPEPLAAAAPTAGARASGLPFPVVGVGASMGGLEAFRELLGNLPADPNLALLYVQHLDPTQPSLLIDILRRATPLPVVQAQQDMAVAVNQVYVIPPHADIALADGHIRLQPRPARRAPHMPIDYLFRSLAEVQQNRAIGVVLSGGGTDGTLGLMAIKAEGGITFAQDEKSARQGAMPRSAITEGWVDHVLPPAEIAGRLVRLAHHPYATLSEPVASPGELDGVTDRILGVLRQATDTDFSQYKRTTINRRIRRRMALRGLDEFEDYLRLLQADQAEAHHLYQDLLIRVTRFFRDEDVYDALKAEVLPRLLKDRSANTPIRVWVAGCSTGEEAYSLAIVLLEHLGDQGANHAIKILATDINEAALEKARAGVYVDNIELDVPPERLQRFFAKVNGHYQVGKSVRDLCVFSRHNLATDPPFSRLDLVSCRNVLIYLDAALQRRILPVLHYALQPGGFLLLGSSETVGPFSDYFTAVDAKHRIYEKNGVPVTMPAGLDFGPFVESRVFSARPRLAAAGWSALDVQKEADRVVLNKYAPVGVVVDESLTVLQFRGRTSAYLEPAPGMASLDLLKMLREGLMGEVRAALARARADGQPVRREGITLREKDRVRLVNLEVLPIRVPPGGGHCFVVLFRDAPPPAPPAAPADGAPGPTAAEQQVAQLQQELASTREYLQSVIEEYESTCEELKSASEEILSSNEELQSTNEELQTAKEETQSANEELVTLNDELKHRNMELAQVNNDLINLLAAVQIPIMLVSRELRIRRITPVAEKVLNLIPTDVGRPFSDIKTNLDVPDLVERIARVIDTLAPHESEVRDTDGRWYSLRIRPYVTLDNKIDGASVILVDIDSLQRSLEKLRSASGGGGEAR